MTKMPASNSPISSVHTSSDDKEHLSVQQFQLLMQRMDGLPEPRAGGHQDQRAAGHEDDECGARLHVLKGVALYMWQGRPMRRREGGYLTVSISARVSSRNGMKETEGIR